MKKVTKKSLDELAKIMPPISEEEQRNYVGGTYYFNESGVFLTQIGNNTDIRITSSSEFSSFLDTMSYTGSLNNYFQGCNYSDMINGKPVDWNYNPIDIPTFINRSQGFEALSKHDQDNVRAMYSHLSFPGSSTEPVPSGNL